jgi:predicted esterase
MKTRTLATLLALLAWLVPSQAIAQTQPAKRLKDEMRSPWSRSNERFIRSWLVLSSIPMSSPEAFKKDWLSEHGGETAIHPAERMSHKLPDGSNIAWRSVTSWSDTTDLGDGAARGIKRDVLGYAFATVARAQAGNALLSIGSDESIRVWLNGALVLDKRTARQLAFDEDHVEVPMKAGENTLLVKLEQHSGSWNFCARVLESGAVPPRVQEIGPSIMSVSSSSIEIRTDMNAENAAQDKVTVEATAAGGKVLAAQTAPRGALVRFNPSAWPDGAYEFRLTTRRLNGLRYAAFLPWYKGDSIAAARKLVAAASRADPKTPVGITTKMLGDMVLDRLGGNIDAVAGDPWWVIHSPLMEYEELLLEAKGQSARIRPYGFYRMAYIDDVDNTPQFCRAYLPGAYDPSKKWPLVIKLHGYNGPNPDYFNWWDADRRHITSHFEYGKGEGVIYMDPHGRGNTTYLGLGDQDILRVIALAKKLFNVDADRVYLTGESMGGWGTWNVGTRHPDLFAAIAPVFGGSDYHSSLSEEQLGKVSPLTHILLERQSSLAMADGLLNTPILVHHGDADRSVNVDFSRYLVHVFERWAYDIRYVEIPGLGHEDLAAMPRKIDWFLLHRRNLNPPRVRIRSAELRNASAYWAAIDQAASSAAFMVLDAEVVAPNTIRVDTENVLALTLSPGASLVDPAKPVRVVWNGAPSTLNLRNGRLQLRAPDYQPAALEKNSAIAGPINDAINTPFAIVTGTASTDPAMNDACRAKAEAAVEFWKQWQKFPPRFFKDSEISDADAARYSLILIGGPDSNLIARKLASKLPLEVAPDHVKIGPRSFPATDAYVTLIYPNPLNPKRYVVIAAATSPGGMLLWDPNRLRGGAFDFTVQDTHYPTGDQQLSFDRVGIANGWFDHAWQMRDDLVFTGDPEARAASTVLHPPTPGLVIDPKILDTYVGEYEIEHGPVISIKRSGDGIVAQVGDQQPDKLLPVSETEFFVYGGPAQAIFEKDDAGKVVAIKGWQNGRTFRAKKR